MGLPSLSAFWQVIWMPDSKCRFVGERVRLGEVAECIRGVTYNAAADLCSGSDENGVPLLRANNISGGKINYEDVLFVNRSKVKSSQFLIPGDILVCASSGSKKLVGKAALVRSKEDMTFGAFCCAVRPKAISPLMLGHYFQSSAYRSAIENVCTGSNINNLKPADFYDLTLPQYGALDQAEKASKLDAILKLIELCEHKLSLLDQLAKSRFVEMFGDPVSNVQGYGISRLGEVLSVQPSNGLYKPQKDYVLGDLGTPIVRIDSFDDRWPSVSSLKRLSCSEKELTRFALRRGDIIVNRVNSVGNMGKTMCVEAIDVPVVFESNMMRFHPDESVLRPRFLAMQMKAPFSKEHFEKRAKRAIGQASINQGDVKSLLVLTPPIELQDQFLDFVARVDKSQFVVRQQIEKLQTLYDSLAQEYFA